MITTLVSVIIPSYNRAVLLTRAIRSVLAQTHQEFEIIVIDDGSTDATEKVMEQFMREDQRIQYARLTHRGPAAARNYGLSQARGAFIAFLDSDDEFLPSKLERQILQFRQSSVTMLGVVGCDGIAIYNDRVIPFYALHQRGACMPFFLQAGSPLIYALIKNEAIQNVRFDERLNTAEDRDLWIQIAKKWNYDFVEEPQFKYYVGEDQISQTTTLARKITDAEYLLRKYQALYEKYPTAYAQGFRNIGTMYFLLGDAKTARLYFRNAFKIYRSCISIGSWLLSFFGRRVYYAVLKQRSRRPWTRAV